MGVHPYGYFVLIMRCSRAPILTRRGVWNSPHVCLLLAYKRNDPYISLPFQSSFAKFRCKVGRLRKGNHYNGNKIHI